MEKSESLISVIVPIYNTAIYLDECVSSIVGQSYSNIEIILVDDGSTDQSGEIADSYAQKDSRIRVVHSENCGVTMAKKTGITISKGEYIGFVDSDDYIDSEMYKNLYGFLVDVGADFVTCGFESEGEWFAENFENGYLDINNDNRIDVLKAFLNRELFKSSAMTLKLYKRELLTNIFMNVTDTNVAEDTAFLFSCLFSVSRVGFINRVFYHYRNRNGSLTNNTDISTLFYKSRACEFMKNTALSHGVYKEIESIFKQYALLELSNYIIRITNNRIRISYAYGVHKPEIFFGKKIVLYGAGQVGKGYYEQLKQFKEIEIVSWMDKNFEGIIDAERTIDNPILIRDLLFDFCIIAIKNEKRAKRIINDLNEGGIDRIKIYWEQPTILC